MLALVERAQAGEQAAFATLVEAYGERIFNYLCRMVNDREEALDLAQETFVRAWESMGRFRGGAAFSTWLYRIATNLAIDAIRKRKRRGWQDSVDAPITTLDGEAERQLPDPSRPLEDQMALHELHREVRRAVSEMPAKLRAVLVMYDFEQMSYEQISRALRVPLGTVKSRLFNARKLLRDKLAASLPIEDYLRTLGEF
jgi:RNA polymerase sigma-70 factor (ECF subfamily)